MNRQDSWLVNFAREYGWRAYAIPVLIVLTIWVVADIVNQSEADGAQTGTVAEQKVSEQPTPTRGPGPNPADQVAPPLDIGQLPPGGPFTEEGTDTYRQVGRPSPKVGQGLDRTYTYVVEVEDGLNTADYGGDDAVAAMVDATLSDPRSWTSDPDIAFHHIGPEEQAQGIEPDLHIQLTSTATTHKHCGNDIEMETSCFTPIGNRVLINESRWVRGAVPFHGDLGMYRQYLINHEVGHGIGYANHEPCPANGQLAPVMMQQTLSLSNGELRKIAPSEIYPNNNDTCRANPWPYPNGVPTATNTAP